MPSKSRDTKSDLKTKLDLLKNESASEAYKSRNERNIILTVRSKWACDNAKGLKKDNRCM